MKVLKKLRSQFIFSFHLILYFCIQYKIFLNGRAMKPMRFLLSILLIIFFTGNAFSQLSVIIFSEQGEKFTVYVNGSPKNNKPESRVETDRPGGPSFKLRIDFADGSIPEISKTIFNSPGHDMFYVIRKANKGKFILEKTSSEYIHHPDKSPTSEKNVTKKEEKEKAETPKSKSQLAGSSGKGCNTPMSEPNFQASREMISNAPFDGPKLSHAKKLADQNCLTTSQIIDVIYVFSGESSRLNFAKYAYNHCWDPGNYDNVKEVLHRSSQNDLQRYIGSQK
jgi:hypothetical protein